MAMLSKLSKTIPPRARIMLILTTLMVVVFSVIIFQTLFSGEEEVSKSDIGLTKVSLNNDTIKMKGNVKSDLVIKDNNIQDTINKFKEAEDKKLRDPNNKVSFISKPDLTIGVDVESESRNNKSNIVNIADIIGKGSIKDNKSTSSSDIATSSSIIKKDDESTNKLKNNLGEKKGKAKRIVNRDAYLASIKGEILAVNVPETGLNYESHTTVISSYGKVESSEVRNQGRGLPIDVRPTSRNNRTQARGSNQGSPKSTRQKAIEKYNEIRKQAETMSGVNGSDNPSNNDDIENSSIVAEASSTSSYDSREKRGAGEIDYAIIDFEINSDEQSLVRATMASGGDAQGAILLGQFQKLNNTIAVVFNTYSKGGVSYPINAIAIDSETWKSSLADDVDNHYFDRYFGVIAASLISGYSETLMNQERYETGSGETGTSTEAISKFSDRLSYAVGKVGATLAPVFLEGMARESTIRVFRDKPIGIMYLQDFKVPHTK